MNIFFHFLQQETRQRAKALKGLLLPGVLFLAFLWPGGQLAGRGLAPSVDTIQARIYVDADAVGGNNDGTSWANAYTDLHSALADSNASALPIWVAEGTYKPTATGDRNAYFAVGAGFRLYGGFAGWESAFSQRDVAANPTILSGEIGDSTISWDNSYHIVVMSDVTEGTRLDGFTVSDSHNGFTSGSVNISGSASIANCTFERDTAYVGGGLGFNGTLLTVDSCVFRHGMGYSGGGALHAGSGTMNVSSCVFYGNAGGDSGGVFFSQSNPSVNFYNCLMYGNRANSYQGAIIFSPGTLTMRHCTVVNNSNRADIAVSPANFSISNTIIWGNDWGPFRDYPSTGVSHSLTNTWYVVPGTGNLNADPLFVGGGDFRLQICSPAINAGDTTGMSGKDLDGQPRAFNGGTVDMGAYEFQGASYVPQVYALSGGGSNCGGDTILPVVLAATELGVAYQWQLNGADDGAPILGDGSPLSYGSLPAGSFAVVATDTASGCTQPMEGVVGVAYGGAATAFVEPFYAHDNLVPSMDDFYDGDVAYGNGLFVAVGMTYEDDYVPTVLSSSDGSTWAAGSFDDSLASHIYVEAIAYGNGLFVSVGEYGLIQSSPDGINWTDRSFPINHPIWDNPLDYRGVTYGDGQWVAVGRGGSVAVSPDGINWAQADSVPMSSTLVNVAYGNGKYVAIGFSEIIHSVDGSNWSFSIGYQGAYSNFYDVAYGAGRFVAVGDYGIFWISEDGVSWTAHESGAEEYFSHIAYHDGQFLASSAYTEGIVLSSPDGVCWALAETGLPYGFEGIASHNGVYVGVNAEVYSTVCRTPTDIAFAPVDINCAESGAIALSLVASEPNYNYQLQRNGNAVGSPMPGTGEAIVFGNYTAAGDYTVVASSLTGGCSLSMTDMRRILAGETPIIAEFGPICAGTPLDLVATASVGNIQWYDAPTGGNLLGSSASGEAFEVMPSGATTYYAQLAALNYTSQAFDFTGDVQIFVVPEGVSSLDVFAKGASGGEGSYEYTPGEGGMVKATLAVTPGDTLYLYVGGTASGEYYEEGGYNGGGSSYYYGGGGGATDVRIGGQDLGDRVLVAGGGGGAGYYNTFGGNGGGLVGAAGNDDYYYPDDAKGGGGGTQSAGGAGGYGYDANGYDGALGIGGDGADYDYYGAGGGGGYYGGGGGGEYDEYVGAGGGGSSYADSVLCSDVVHTQGGNIGNGQLVLVWGDGCISTDRTAVAVEPSTYAPSVNISADPGDDVDTGTEVIFTATPTNGGDAPTYQWFLNDEAVPGATGSSFSSSSLADGDWVSVDMASNDPCAVPNAVSSGTIVMSVSDPVPCGKAPNGVKFTLQSPNSVYVDWRDAFGAQTYIVLWRVVGSGAPFQRANVVRSNYTITGLLPGTTYAVRVRSKCAASFFSANTAVFQFTTPDGSGNCVVPTISVVDSASTNRVRVYWGYVPGATGYRVQFREQGTTAWQSRPASEANLFVNGITPGIPYEYRVQSECPSGPTDYSSIYVYTLPSGSTGAKGAAPEANLDEARPAVALYPNPVREAFTLENAEGADVAIFNSMGQQMWQGQIAEAQQRIGVAHLPAGLYVVQVRRADSAPEVLRFVKE